MRLLADENLNEVEVNLLRERGHNLVWIEEETPGIEDLEVLLRATNEERLLLTHDKGHFGRLVFRCKQNAPYGIILFRIHQPPDQRALTLALIIESRTNWEGNFSVANDEKNIRMTPIPSI